MHVTCRSWEGGGVWWGSTCREPDFKSSTAVTHFTMSKLKPRGHPGGEGGAVPSVQPWTALAPAWPWPPQHAPRGAGKGNFFFPGAHRTTWFMAAAECALPETLNYHARMNNRSSPDAERLLRKFSRRLETLSRVLAEVTACLSYSGLGEEESAGGEGAPLLSLQPHAEA